MRILRINLFLLSLLFPIQSIAQIRSDTVYSVPEVVISVYPSKQYFFRSTASVGVLEEQQLQQQPSYTLVPTLNTIAGVRMEERSPGSYRLSIRGSLLRSPFGIRNVKLYFDEFPLTDAGGNSYLNALDAGAAQRIEILKGPEGSLFGATTGGVILLQPLTETEDSTHASLSLTGGSYGLFHEKARGDKQWKKYRMQVYQAYQQADGYRENSALKRLYVQTIQQWNYTSTNRVKLLGIYTDLNYQTPGGLTNSQYEDSPRLARPAAGPFQGAGQQQAAIYNTTGYLGLSHEVAFSPQWKQVLTVFGSQTDFKNPFITNYEVRKENSLGARSYIEWKYQASNFMQWKWNIGLEAQQTQSIIDNYGNRSGQRDTMQFSDQLKARQVFYFSQFSLDLRNRWILEAAVSLNNYGYAYQNSFPTYETTKHEITFTPEWLPRFSFSYKINTYFAWRAAVSKGYSPPTLAEVRPSTASIYTDLQPETGWNYETGLRVQTPQRRIAADLVFFYFQLDQAIVRRVNSGGAEYFVNAGGTRQPGIEVQWSADLIRQDRFSQLKRLLLRNSITYYDFSFTNYQVANDNYSNHALTGVPPWTVVSSLTLDLVKSWSLYIQHQFVDRLPLNDANSVFAAAYHLLQLKMSWNYSFANSSTLQLFAGIDNVLSTKYSLGNDLNALGNRYFNAAPARNFYGGASVSF